MQKQYSVIINAPIQKVFASISEKEALKRQMGGHVKRVFKEASNLHDTVDFHNPVGTKFHESILGLLEYDGEILDYEPPHLLGFNIEVAGLKGYIFYKLDAVEAKKTKLMFNLEIFDPTTTKKVMLRSLFPLFERIIKFHLKSLKKIGEE